LNAIVSDVTGTSEVERLIEITFGQNSVMKKIAYCESGFQEKAIGDGHLTYMHNGVEYGKSYGVFQIRHLPGRPDPKKLMEAEFNIAYAKKLYDASRLSPWVNCTRKVGAK
jgi:hypothetical protein